MSELGGQVAQRPDPGKEARRRDDVEMVGRKGLDDKALLGK